LQHHALHRDVEVCVFDARGVGNGFLLPAGPLREAWPRTPLALTGLPLPQSLVLCATADVQPAPMGVAGTGTQPVYHARRRLADFALSADGQHTPLNQLRGQALAAVAAIAQPEQFFAMLRACGLTLGSTEVLPDHYDFDSWICNIGVGKTLICTEKDAVKLWRKHPEALAVPLELSLDPAFLPALDAAINAIGAKLSSPHGHPIA
jgi:tetraacyldisaccharide 4'-kinase